jgi:predicted nucleic acid-binding protein
MIVYVDTSVLLRVLFREPYPVSVWGSWDGAYSSSLLRVEALRTVDRLRLSGHLTDQEVAVLTREIQTACDTVALVPPVDSILDRASGAYPTVVGTLDAIHLATALAVRQTQPLDLFLTHDRRLGLAAQSLGMEVLGM